MKVFIWCVFLALLNQGHLQPGNIESPQRQLHASHHNKREYVDGKIVGGYNAVIGQFPWQVAVTMDGSSFCGGGVISDVWVMTAGQCVAGFTSFTLVFGSLTRDGGAAGSVVHASTSQVLHGGYDPDTLANDIGLVLIPEALTFSSEIAPIRLPTHSQEDTSFAGQEVFASGWGKTSDGSDLSSTLKWVILPVISNSQCESIYGSQILPTNICASGANGHSTCDGDNGGAVTWQDIDEVFIAVGIVSFRSTSGGCIFGYPVAFTRVTGYLDWIQTNTGIVIQD